MTPRQRYRSHPWHVADIARDFTLDEVWEFPIVADDAKKETFAAFFEAQERAGIDDLDGLAGMLVKLRGFLSRVGFDGKMDESKGRFPFRVVYESDDERLLEISNSTVHGLVHFAWMQRDDTRYSPVLAVYVKPRGWFGRLYMAAIYPFRVLVVYPALMRAAKRRWDNRSGRESGT